jgi:hypothetical protein
VETAATTWRPANRSGHRGAHARGQQGRGNGPGEEGGDAWACAEAGGGAQGAASAAAGAEQRGSGGARGRRSREVSVGLVCNSQKFQGPFYKLKFLTATKVK